MAGTNAALKPGDILIDSASRTTVKVIRLVGSTLVEITNIGVAFANSKVVDVSALSKGIASGKVKRVSSI